MQIKRPFSETDWLATPEPVRKYIEMLEQSILHLTSTVAELKERLDKLELKTKANSQNSNQPPSSDPPFNRPEKLHEGADNEAGKLARSLASAMDTLWVFLEEHGVEPTNNRAERALRFGVIWRKRCFGSQSDKGNRWVERVLSIKGACRIRGKASFPVLIDLVSAYFKEQQPNLAWIA